MGLLPSFFLLFSKENKIHGLCFSFFSYVTNKTLRWKEDMVYTASIR